MKILENPGFCYSSGNYRKSVTSIAKKRISQQQKTRSDAAGRSFEMNFSADVRQAPSIYAFKNGLSRETI